MACGRILAATRDVVPTDSDRPIPFTFHSICDIAASSSQQIRLVTASNWFHERSARRGVRSNKRNTSWFSNCSKNNL
jgi:hypothetical protein